MRCLIKEELWDEEHREGEFMKFSLLTLYVEKLEPSLIFYRDLMGMAEVERIQTPNGAIVFLGENDNVQLELIESSEHKGMKYTGFSVGFDVEQMEIEIEKLEAKGFRKISGPMSPNGSTLLAFFEGPNGEKIELIQH